MERKLENIVVVFLSCRWEDTETYCLQRLAELTDDHYVMPFDFAPCDIEPKEVVDSAKEKKPGLKLLILVNNNKSVTRYNHMYRLHFKFEEYCKVCLPIILNIQEEVFCPEHDKMTPEMQRRCDNSIKSVKIMLDDPNPDPLNKLRMKFN